MKKMIVGFTLLLTLILSGCNYLTPIIGDYSYTFEITDREKDSFVLTNEKAIIYMREKEIYQGESLQFYVTNFNEIFYNEYTDEIGLSRNNYGYRQIVAILDRIYHEEGNYGLIFGMANHIAEQQEVIYLGYAHDESEILAYVNYRPEIMDLTYPLFDEEYSDINTRAYAQEFATMFTKYLIDKYSVEMLDQLIKVENDELFAQLYYKYLNEFLADAGLDPYYPDYYIVFSRHTSEYLFTWKTENANWHLEDDFVDTFFYVSHPELFNDGYYNLVNLIRSLEYEMERTREIFGLNDQNYKTIDIYLVDSRNTGYYRNNITFLSSIFSLSHEYIHHLQSSYLVAPTWLVESQAIYYSMEYEFTKVYFERIYQIEGLQDEIARAITTYKDIYGMNARYDDDVYEFADVYVYANNDFDDVYEQYNNDSFFQYVSFTNYFIELYGEELYTTAVENSDNIVEYTGYTWEMLINNWEMHIKSKY